MACLSLIFMGLWLILRVRIIMQFVKFMVVTQMFFLEGKECRCFYHWEENLWIHTKNFIFLVFKEDHIDRCKQWAHSPTWKEFEMNCVRIEVWWNDSRATIPTNVPKFQQWLCWWVKKSTHYNLWMNLTLRKKLWGQQPISLQVSIISCGFFMEMDTRW